MNFTKPTLFFVALLVLPAVAGGIYFFCGLMDLRTRRGRVSESYFGLPDIFLGGLLAAYFGYVGFYSLRRNDAVADLKPELLLSNAAFMLAMLVVVVFFALMRRIPVSEAAGTEWRHFGPAIPRALVGLAGALPLVWVVNLTSAEWLAERAQEQSLLMVFRKACSTGEWSTVGAVALSAVLIAPLVEEGLFRGYFYGTLKRYFGSLLSAGFTSALFAFSHGSPVVMAGLFVLSLCLTLSYERHGSLWVPIVLHSSFNALSLLTVYLQARGILPR